MQVSTLLDISINRQRGSSEDKNFMQKPGRYLVVGGLSQLIDVMSQFSLSSAYLSCSTKS